MRGVSRSALQRATASLRSRQIAAFLAADENAVLPFFFSQLKHFFYVSFRPSVFPFGKKEEVGGHSGERHDGKCAASVRRWRSTHVGILFDRHKQFFLQVNDGSNGLRQLQRVFVHKAIHCVAVHVLTHSVDL